MREFEKLCEEYSKKSRTIKRTERYPRDIIFSREFLEAIEEAYFTKFHESNRNFHSNFLKALSFELDRFKDNSELATKYAPEFDEDDRKED